jgi:hypothetical protein
MGLGNGLTNKRVVILAGVYCGFSRQISKSSFLWSLGRTVGITHVG